LNFIHKRGYYIVLMTLIAAFGWNDLSALEF